jgi:hypothetical protein
MTWHKVGPTLYPEEDAKDVQQSQLLREIVIMVKD